MSWAGPTIPLQEEGKWKGRLCIPDRLPSPPCLPTAQRTRNDDDGQGGNHDSEVRDGARGLGKDVGFRDSRGRGKPGTTIDLVVMPFTLSTLTSAGQMGSRVTPLAEVDGFLCAYRRQKM